MKALIVVDMQNDFVTGSLGSREAVTIAPHVAEKAGSFDGLLVFTKDTHDESYLSTQEGKMLPVEHCIKGTEGWALIPELEKIAEERNAQVFEKGAFGSTDLACFIRDEYEKGYISEVELIGVCTDICVISNALLIKAFAPELPVFVDSSCCAGVSPERHNAALETMRSCQVSVI